MYGQIWIILQSQSELRALWYIDHFGPALIQTGYFSILLNQHTFQKNPVNCDILNFKYYIFGVSIQIFIEFELCPNFHILGSVRPYGSLDPNGDFVLRSLCQSLAAQAVRSWARLNAVELSTTHWVVLNRLLFSFGIVFVSLSVCQFVFHDKYQSNKYEKIQQGNLPPIQVPTGALGVQSHLGSFHLLLPVPGLLDVCRGHLPLFKGWFFLCFPFFWSLRWWVAWSVAL